MSWKFNPFTGRLDLVDQTIPQFSSDPSSPAAEDVWVRKNVVGGGAGSGEPYGLLLALTQPGEGAGVSYDLSYRTKEGTTIRVELS